MKETFFDRSFAIDRLRRGPLAGHIDLLADWLSTQGYSRVHSRIQIRYIGHFNRWLERKGLTAKQVDEEMIEHLWHSFMRRKRVRRGDMSALFTLLDFLRERGVAPHRTIKAVLSLRESHVENYRSYLREERGLSYDSIRKMLPFVDHLQAVKYPHSHIDFRLLTADDITTFVRKQAAELGSAKAKHMVTAFRGFLRYLRHRGDIDTNLAGCVPSVPHYSFLPVPRFLPTGSVEKILQLTDQSTPTGRRDRAMLMPGSDFAPAKLSAWNLKISIGNSARSRSEARAEGGPNCRCRPMLATPLPLTFSMTIHVVQHGVYSSLNALRSEACLRDVRS